MDFFKNWLSIDEQRVSALILCLVSAIGMALYSYMTKGDFSDNLVRVIEVLVTAVAGVNVASTVMGYFNRLNNSTSRVDSNRSEEGPPPTVNNAGKL